MPMIQATPSQVVAIAEAILPRGIPLLLFGPPGVGKTRITAALATRNGWRIVWLHPVTLTPVDVGGFPDLHTGPDGLRQAHFTPIGAMREILAATGPTLVLIEDVATALPSVVAALMQVVWERKIGEHRVPDCVMFAMTTNRREDHAASSGMISPMVSRCCSVEMGVSVPEWQAWAAAAGIHPLVTTYIRTRPMALHAPPTRTMEPFPTPRAWESLSRILTATPAATQEDALLLPLAQGFVGSEHATGLLAVLRTQRRLPDIAGFLRDPLFAPLPTEGDLLWCLVSGVLSLATGADPDRENVVRLGVRLLAEREEYGSALLEGYAAKHGPQIMAQSATYRAATAAGGPIADGLVRAKTFAEQVKGGTR